MRLYSFVSGFEQAPIPVKRAEFQREPRQANKINGLSQGKFWDFLPAHNTIRINVGYMSAVTKPENVQA